MARINYLKIPQCIIKCPEFWQGAETARAHLLCKVEGAVESLADHLETSFEA